MYRAGFAHMTKASFEACSALLYSSVVQMDMIARMPEPVSRNMRANGEFP
jgi:hypothetical protein